MNRSLEKITRPDLRKLLSFARVDIDDFFARNPKYSRLYKGKEVLIALCQGAALHFIDGKNGIKDFDVWFFYPKYSKQLPYRRRGTVDFGPSKFGLWSEDVGYKGRRIDVLMRSDQAFACKRPEEGLRKYFANAKTATAKHLLRKAVIGLYPKAVFGKILWP